MDDTLDTLRSLVRPQQQHDGAMIAAFDVDGTVVKSGTGEQTNKQVRSAMNFLMKMAPVVVMATMRQKGQNTLAPAAAFNDVYGNVVAHHNDPLGDYFFFGQPEDDKVPHLNKCFGMWKDVIRGLRKDQIVLFDDEEDNIEAAIKAGYQAVLVKQLKGTVGGLSIDDVDSITWSTQYPSLFEWSRRLNQEPAKRQRTGTAKIVQALMKTNGNVHAAARLILSGH